MREIGRVPVQLHHQGGRFTRKVGQTIYQEDQAVEKTEEEDSMVDDSPSGDDSIE